MSILQKQKQEIREYTIDRLKEGIGDVYSADLHHHLFNEDYYIIGTHRAKQWLGEDVWDAIDLVNDYETENFGERTTDTGDAEKLANMVAYILGEQVLQESEILAGRWDEMADENCQLAIAGELAGEWN